MSKNPHGYYRIDFVRSVASGWAAHAEAVEVMYEGRKIARVVPKGRDEKLVAQVPAARAFELVLPRRFPALDVVAEKLRFVAVRERIRRNLTPTDGFRAVMTDRARQELDSKAPTTGKPGGGSYPLRVPNPDPTEFSPIYLPVGFSADPAILGYDGMMFLAGGSNSLLDQYAMPGPKAARLAVQWEELIRSRAERCEELGVQYIQTILPEKLSVLRAWAPMQIDGPTPLYRRVNRRVAREPWWVNSYPLLDNMKAKQRAFFKTDTHLSPIGTRRVAANLFAPIDNGLRGHVNRVKLSSTLARRGDLGKYFGTQPFYERFPIAVDADFGDAARGVDRTGYGAAENGRHRGLWFDFENSAAPSSRSVLVFGSSSFGPGDYSEHLGWWAKHLFSRYKMRWQSEFDWELIERERPDVVIGQTIERFMPEVPTS
ncbi:alginate O-acetyltransferase AlgX-related protein [Zhihengliuella flava]|uniref:AlgX/AlgJ SGNH hydrolase-like domain-containing protein n=1 Tax=Zhihengliuella flava TaxID=1285193 RepID=A0A931D369_9MICC|nr:hypothetical protein [Zhihengliuella flava]MBG6083549.1 hypothetical protein [Zhihengliuella flava]